MYVCMYIYIHTYIHTYIPTCMPSNPSSKPYESPSPRSKPHKPKTLCTPSAHYQEITTHRILQGFKNIQSTSTNTQTKENNQQACPKPSILKPQALSPKEVKAIAPLKGSLKR